MRIIAFHNTAWEDYLYWQKNDKQILKKVNALLKEIIRDPFYGTGKPEPLVGNLTGFWSRRINREHRLVYKVMEDQIVVAKCRHHY